MINYTLYNSNLKFLYNKSDPNKSSPQTRDINDKIHRISIKLIQAENSINEETVEKLEEMFEEMLNLQILDVPKSQALMHVFYNAISLLPNIEHAHVLKSVFFKLQKRYGYEILAQEAPLSFLKKLILNQKVQYSTILIYIRILEINKSEDLYEIAHLCLLQDPNIVINVINDFNIEDEGYRVKLAKICAQIMPIATAKNIQSFRISISNQRAWFEIAEICMQKNGAEVARYISNFCIQDEDNRVDLAMMCANQSVERLILWIPKFKIDYHNLGAYFKIAKLCASKDPVNTAQHIKSFLIHNVQLRIELARLCIESSPISFARFIPNFDIPEKYQQSLIHLAQLCAIKDGKNTACFFHHFKIKSEDNQFELARICISQSKESIAFYIQNFGIDPRNQKSLVKLAELCAAQNGIETAQFIKNFRIADEKDRIKLAFLCAKTSVNSIAPFIRDFGINDKNQEILIQLARVCANQNGRETAKFIKDFQILDENIRVELAIQCMFQSNKGIAESIPNFNINPKNQEAYIKLAFLNAEKNGTDTAHYIHYFKIGSQEELVKIAKLSAQQDGRGTADFFYNFQIIKEEDRMELAKLCWKQNGSSISRFFTNFDIQNEAYRFEFAKMSATSDAKSTFLTIHKFKLSKSADRLAVAKICAERAAELVYRNFGFFYLEDPQESLQLQAHCIIHDPSLFRAIVSSHGSQLAIRQIVEEPKIYEQIASLDPWDETIALNLLEKLCKFHEMGESYFQWIKELAATETDIHIREGLIDSVTITTWLVQAQLTSLQRKQLEDFDFLRDIYDICPNHLLLVFVQVAIEHIKDTQRLENLQEILKGRSIPPLANVGCLVLSLIHPDLVEDFLKFLNANPKIFKDAVKARLLLSCLYFLQKDCFLSIKEKSTLILRIFASKKPYVSLLHLQSIFNLEEGEALKGIQNEEDLAQIFQRSLQIKIRVKDDGNMAEKLEETFGASRNPLAIWQYAAQMYNLHDPSIMGCLGLFISSVANHIFFQVRYDAQLNRHLKALKPEILNLWKQGMSIELKQDKQSAFEPISWLQEHLPKPALYPNLDRYLNAKTEQERVEIINNLIEAIKNEKDSKRRSSLYVENYCIGLTKAQPAYQRIRLLEIQKALEKQENQGSVSGFKVAIQAKIQEMNPLTSLQFRAIDTDDPYDLLFAGEIPGSCQRIGESSELNKGLLGYVMNGQTRLLAVKDNKQRVVARAMLRLLISPAGLPVLFIEKIYGNASHEKDLYNLAKAKAKEMGLPLAHRKEGVAAHYKLSSLGGIAPFEYVDGANGLCKDSRYQIQGCRLVFDPNRPD